MLNRLLDAIGRVRAKVPAEGSRAATYLRTYPALLALASCPEVEDSMRFLQLAAAAYGWMPRIVRLDPEYLSSAIDAFRQAPEATDANWPNALVEQVAACLHSVVGASKLLHFANPAVFPIWDKKVERFWLSAEPSQYHMDQDRHYKAYALRVHEIRREPSFPEFYEALNLAFAERLGRLAIPPYRLTEVRSIETAAFELAGNEDDDGPG